MTTIKNILFDFDGTIANTAPGILATLKQSFILLNRPIPDDDSMRSTIGLPLAKAFQVLSDFSDDEAQQAVEVYHKLFMEFEVPRILLFPDVLATLEELSRQGISMAIVTSRDRQSLDLILRNHSIHHFFQTSVTINDHLPSKPAPDMVLALLERMQIRSDETLVVGDTTYDILMGNRASCPTCAVTYGNHTAETLASVHPTFTIHHFSELLSLFHSS